MLSVQLRQGANIEIKNGEQVLACNYYELAPVLDTLRRSRHFPEACTVCLGAGDVAWPEEEPRDISRCPHCEGTRIEP